MLDIHYIIENEFRCHTVNCDGITVIAIGGIGYNKLGDSEQDIFISDCITHEFIHALLENIFNPTTSELFEFIGDGLLNKRVLKKAVCLVSADMLWSDAVNEDGNTYIYDIYLIDNIDLIQCYLICNTRLNNE